MGAAGQGSLPFLSPVFTDHMVLQRDQTNTFWGWTAPGTDVSVEVAGHRGHGVADAKGKWMARFSPPQTGGPYTVTITGPKKVELSDVLVGDVWICSGQSNMEFGIGMTNNSAAEIAAANDDNLRLCLLPHQISPDSAAHRPRRLGPMYSGQRRPGRMEWIFRRRILLRPRTAQAIEHSHRTRRDKLGRDDRGIMDEP